MSSANSAFDLLYSRRINNYRTQLSKHNITKAVELPIRNITTCTVLVKYTQTTYRIFSLGWYCIIYFKLRALRFLSILITKINTTVLYYLNTNGSRRETQYTQHAKTQPNVLRDCTYGSAMGPIFARPPTT